MYQNVKNLLKGMLPSLIYGDNTILNPENATDELSGTSDYALIQGKTTVRYTFPSNTFIVNYTHFTSVSASYGSTLFIRFLNENMEIIHEENIGKNLQYDIKINNIVKHIEISAVSTTAFRIYDIRAYGFTQVFKHLIKSSNKIQTLSNGVWINTELIEPLTKLDFETYGIDNISNITTEQWSNLDGDEFEVITWTNYHEIDTVINNQLIAVQLTNWAGGKMFEFEVTEDQKINNILGVNIE